MKNFMTMYYSALEVVECTCGITTGTIVNVTLNYRAKNRFGQCKRNVDGTYELNFNHLIFDDKANDNAVMETIIHEILHTCKGCMNHGKEWKRLANIVKEKTGYEITRCGSYSDFGIDSPIKERKKNYVFKCEKCGQKIVRQRMSDFVKRYDKYRCGICGGNFQFIPEESNHQILTVKPKSQYVESMAY